MQAVLGIPTPEVGAINALNWNVEIGFSGLYGDPPQRLVVEAFHGNVVFYRHRALQGGGIAVPAEYLPRNDSRRYSNLIAPIRLKTYFPGDAFERVESFRSGGPLFARLEGQFKVWALGDQHANENARVQYLFRALAPAQCDIFHTVNGNIEDIHHAWMDSVLPAFGKPYRVLIEAALPKLQAQNETGARVIAHLQRADDAFNNGRFPESAMAVFNAIEALQDLYPLLDAAYEDQMISKRIREQVAAIRGLANDPRHDEAHLKRPQLTVDRVLAQHLITSTKSIAGVIMQAVRST